MQISKVNIKNECLFLFGAIDVLIGDHLIHLKRNQIETIELPKGNYTIKATNYWLSGCRQVEVNADVVSIVVRRRIPEILYVLVFSLLTTLLVLYFFSLTNWLLLNIFVNIGIAFKVWNSFFAKNTYFKISLYS